MQCSDGSTLSMKWLLSWLLLLLGDQQVSAPIRETIGAACISLLASTADKSDGLYRSMFQGACRLTQGAVPGIPYRRPERELIWSFIDNPMSRECHAPVVHGGTPPQIWRWPPSRSAMGHAWTPRGASRRRSSSPLATK
jgi:hypothetical protein